MRQARLAGLVLACGLLIWRMPPAHAESMTLSQCLDAAMAHNAMLRAAGHEIDAKDYERKSVRGRFGPVVKADANVLFWQDEQVIDLGFGALGDIFGELLADPIIQGMLTPETLAQAGDLQNMETALVAREQITYGVKLTVAQPLTPLYKVYSGYWAAGELADAARQDRAKARHDLQVDVVRAFIGLVTATRMMETAEAGLAQIEAYEKQVQAYLDAGLVERNALLKVRVAKAEIQKGAFQADKGRKLARAGLNLYMGRPLDRPIEPAYNFDDPAETRSAGSLEETQRAALRNRPDLLSLRHKSEAARAGKHAAIAAMLPDINAVFMYENNQGLGAFQQESVYYGGFVLSWNLWEWGATYYQIKAAESREAQIRAGLEALDDGVRLDVQSKRLDAEEAEKSLAVARAQQAEAAESLRIEQARFEAQDATTTDLLEAQTAALRAENGLTVSMMKLEEARYALRVSLGEDLTAVEKEERNATR
ncbi:MAG: TolC family protein [Myxococcales bacterium]|nr:MAG: TolC family protein [Myxococcales bacterium]